MEKLVVFPALTVKKAAKWWDKLSHRDKLLAKDKAGVINVTPAKIPQIYIMCYKNAPDEEKIPKPAHLLGSGTTPEKRRDKTITEIVNIVNDFKLESGGEWVNYTFGPLFKGLSYHTYLLNALIKLNIIQRQGTATFNYVYHAVNNDDITREEAEQVLLTAKKIAAEYQIANRLRKNKNKNKAADNKVHDNDDLKSNVVIELVENRNLNVDSSIVECGITIELSGSATIVNEFLDIINNVEKDYLAYITKSNKRKVIIQQG